MWIIPDNYTHILNSIRNKDQKSLIVFLNQPNIVKQEIIENNLEYKYINIFENQKKLTIDSLSILWILIKKNYREIDNVYEFVFKKIIFNYKYHKNINILHFKFLDLIQTTFIYQYYQKNFNVIKWILKINKKYIDLFLYKNSNKLLIIKSFIQKYKKILKNFTSYLIANQEDDLINFMINNCHTKINKFLIIQIFENKQFFIKIYNKNENFKLYISNNIFKLSKIIKKKNLENIIPEQICNSPEYILSCLSCKLIEKKYNQTFLKTNTLPWNKTFKILINKKERETLIENVIIIDKKYGNHHIKDFLKNNINNSLLINSNGWMNIVNYLKKDNKEYLYFIFSQIFIKNISFKVSKLFLDNIKELPFLFLKLIIIKFIKNKLNKKSYLKKKIINTKIFDYILKNNYILTPRNKAESEKIHVLIQRYNSIEYHELKNLLWKLFRKVGFLEIFYKKMKMKINIEKIECPVCYEEIEEKKGCCLSCNHVFHKKCLNEYYKIGNTYFYQSNDFKLDCPYCRKILLRY